MSDVKDCGCEHVNAIKIAELEKRLSMHVSYQKEAVDKAASELRERLAIMNEFREQLKDQATKFITREEMVLQLDPMNKTIQELAKWQANREGRIWSFGIMAALAGGAIGSLVAFLLK